MVCGQNFSITNNQNSKYPPEWKRSTKHKRISEAFRKKPSTRLNKKKKDTKKETSK